VFLYFILYFVFCILFEQEHILVLKHELEIELEHEHKHEHEHELGKWNMNMNMSMNMVHETWNMKHGTKIMKL